MRQLLTPIVLKQMKVFWWAILNCFSVLIYAFLFSSPALYTTVLYVIHDLQYFNSGLPPFPLKYNTKPHVEAHILPFGLLRKREHGLCSVFLSILPISDVISQRLCFYFYNIILDFHIYSLHLTLESCTSGLLTYK